MKKPCINAGERLQRKVLKYLREMAHELIAIRQEWELFRSQPLITTKDLKKTETKVIMKVSELKGSLDQVKAIAVKSFGELRAKVDELDAKIVTLTEQLGSADAEVPADALATLEEVKVVLGQIDEIVPDASELPPAV